MFLPNLDCVIHKKGEPDVYGQVRAGRRFRERCAVIKAKLVSEPSTVRADSGATRGHADEFTTNNRIMLTSKTIAKIDDRLDVVGFQIRIKVMHPRFNVMGKLDHYEVEGETWV